MTTKTRKATRWRIDKYSTRAVIWTDRPGDWKPGDEPDPSGRKPKADYITLAEHRESAGKAGL